jgi:hypothetical protein
MRGFVAGLFLLSGAVIGNPACAVQVSDVTGGNTADELIKNAEDVYNAMRVVCSGVSDEIARVANVAKVNTTISGVGTVAAAGALAVGIKKAATDEEIEEMISVFCSGNNNCQNSGDDPDYYNKVIKGLADVAEKAGLADDVDEVKNKITQVKNLGNWRTGLMAGTVGTNLATAILSSRNMNQSELIQQISACNDMVQQAGDIVMALKAAGVNPFENSVVGKLDDAKTWCNQIEIADVEKIEKRMKASLGTSVAGGVIGVAGTATSVAANSDKYTAVEQRVQLSEADRQKVKNLNVAANIMSGAGVVTGVTGTVLNVSLISLAKKLMNMAERCEEVLK